MCLGRLQSKQNTLRSWILCSRSIKKLRITYHHHNFPSLLRQQYDNINVVRNTDLETSFCIFLGVISDCFAVILWGVLTTLSSGPSTVPLAASFGSSSFAHHFWDSSTGLCLQGLGPTWPSPPACRVGSSASCGCQHKPKPSHCLAKGTAAA